MELLQRPVIGGSERSGEFLRLVGLTILQGLAGKREAAEKPHQAFSSRSLFLPFFVFNQLFEGGGESRGSIISGANFLCSVRWISHRWGDECEMSSGAILQTHDDVAFDVRLHGREGGRTQ